MLRCMEAFAWGCARVNLMQPVETVWHVRRPAGSPQQPSGQAPLQRKGSLFVANEKGEMVPADNYLEELARQNPKWRQ